MRFSDIDQVSKVIRSSGIGTHTQREAIIQRVYDWFNNHRDRRYESAPTKEQPHEPD